MQAICLEIPALPENLLICRLTLSGYCTRLGMDYNAIEDAKVALTEACMLLMHRTRCGVLSIRLWQEEGLRLCLQAQSQGGSQDLSGFDDAYSELLLRALAGKCDIAAQSICFTLA